MTGHVTINLSSTGLDRLFNDTQGPVAKHLKGIARKVQNEAQHRCPTRSGNLQRSIKVRQKTTAGKVEFFVGSDLYYAKWVLEGTKNNGTGYIKPKNGKWLIFRGSGPYSGKKYRFNKVRGQRANNFLLDALEDVMANE